MVQRVEGRTRVKICGITRPEDGEAAARMGADAVGLIFYPPSPRVVSLPQANAVIDALPPFVNKVALFVNPQRSEVQEVVERLPVDLLQFHGDEDPDFCASFGVSYIKALRMRPGVDLATESINYHHSVGVLLDSYRTGEAGGTGTTFDWSVVPTQLAKPIVLAGGLSAENVRSAIERVRPYGVDVSSGVERSPGIKESSKIAAFMRGVARADGDRGE